MALRLALISADGASAIALFFILSLVRFGADNWQQTWLRMGLEPLVPAVAYALFWASALWLQGLYRLRARWTVRSEALDVVRAGTFLAVAAFASLYILKLPQVSRLFVITLIVVQVATTILSRLVLRWAFARARERGLNIRLMLVVGTGGLAQQFADRVERHRDLGLRVIGHLEHPATADTAARGFSLSRPVIGTVDDIETVLHSQVVDEIAICLPPPAWGVVEPITRICEEEGKIVRIPLVDGGPSIPGGRLEEFEGHPLASLVYGPDRILGLLGKRLIDVGLSAAALLVLSPILALTAIVIRFIDGNPVLFTQTRVGLHGREFRVVKFRTMIPDAEDRLEDLLDQNEISGHAFKLTDDPRLSRTGRWLRRTSIDELPQLWNVLKGEMSIVGPRPPLPREVAGYDIWHRRRLSMKPGITGLWQVSARNDEDFDRWVALDLDYIERWSLWLDLKIMLRTIPAMIQGR
jgi:exopolysaccharide biosynthesis polyprenyl glycosylphosphotransferase